MALLVGTSGTGAWIAAAALAAILAGSGCAPVPPPNADLIAAGVGRLEVRVECARTGWPLPAQVLVRETDSRMAAGEGGYAALELPGGHWYEVVARGTCHLDDSLRVFVGTGDVQAVRLRLREGGCILD